MRDEGRGVGDVAARTRQLVVAAIGQKEMQSLVLSLSVVCSHHRLFMRLGAARQQPIQNIQNQIDNNSQQAIRQPSS
jgi:hypothetical protein